MVVLRTEGLTKHFGSTIAVQGLDLEVRTGEVHGFLGPNGSGKSTTVGMVLGLLRPTAGRALIFGEDARTAPHHLRRRVGAIIESPAFYPYLSGRANLKALALVAGGVPPGRIEALLEQVGLSERADSPYKTYSLGMKQRLGIASTLLTDPDLVILDEPTSGLDPAGQREIRELIPQLARAGRAVLLASHLLHEVQQVADRVTIIRRGQVVESGPVSSLVLRGSYLEVGIEPIGEAVEVVRALPFVEDVQVLDGKLAVRTAPDQAAAVNRALAERGLYASSLGTRASTLEDVFLELTTDQKTEAPT
jgi:ABC-2 type transport system ATP-binding protein